MVRSVLLAVALQLSLVAVLKADDRVVSSLDRGWLFHFGELNENPQAPDFNADGWDKIDVPHDWMLDGHPKPPVAPPASQPAMTGRRRNDPSTRPSEMDGPFDRNSNGRTDGGALNGGIGWYRKTINLPADVANHRVFIQFDGVYMDSEVWLNGEHVGVHPYGYTSFAFELTKVAKPGPNLLAVKTNVVQPCSRFYSGGGIYRHVWLTLTNPVHIEHWGTFVTSEVKDGVAKVTVHTLIANESDKPANVTLTENLVAPNGQDVGTATASSLQIEAGKTAEGVQTIDVPSPNLWSIENPALYQLKSAVTQDGQAVDSTQTPFGIRTIEFTVDKGFFLNGQHVNIRGVCDHHDLGCLGAAVNTRAIERQLEILKGMGCNAIRTSHYPPAPELLDLCDRMGFVVMDEAFDEWKNSKTRFGYGRFFDEWSESDLTSMIHRDRNHPSIVLWSVGNEIREQSARNGEEMMTRMVGIAHREDPTRMTVSAISDPNGALKSGFYKPLDVFGVNYQVNFYTNETVHGHMPMIGSETSSDVSSRGEYQLSLKDGKVVAAASQPTEDQVTSYDTYAPKWATSAETDLKSIEGHPWMAGEFVWTGFDYIGEPTPFPWPARSSYFGINDLAGFPKDRYYLYQSHWTTKPMVHLLPTNWNWDGFEGHEIPVWCYTNAESVELFLNDKSLGEKKIKESDTLHLAWTVPYAPGTLKAVAKNGGQIVATDSVVTAGKPAKLVLTADHSKIQSGIRDLSFVTVSVVDDQGHPCPNANDNISYTIDGPGFIAGLDDGDSTNHQSFRGKEHRVFHGLGLAVVQAKDETGDIHLNATAKDLAPASVTITVQAEK